MPLCDHTWLTAWISFFCAHNFQPERPHKLLFGSFLEISSSTNPFICSTPEFPTFFFSAVAERTCLAGGKVGALILNPLVGFSAPYTWSWGENVFSFWWPKQKTVRIKVDYTELKTDFYFFPPDFTGNLKPLGNVILNQSQTLCLADMKYFIFRLFDSFKSSV